MRNLKIIMLVMLIVGTVVQQVFAVSPTPTANSHPTTPAVSTIEQQINNLKDRIASRVAQLNLVEKRGIIGTVSDISGTQITLTDLTGAIRLVDVDELTKFSSPTVKTSFGISDISKGQTLGVIGLYNKDSRHLLARFVDVVTLTHVIYGGILTVDKDNFNLTVATANNDEVFIDVENITKTYSYQKVTGLIRSGFSKLAVGQRVIIVGYPDAKDKNKIVASRVTIFPDLPINPAITLIKSEDINPVTPSTGSGKVLTPITH